MSTYFQQALYVSDAWGNPSEVINGSRTAARLASIGSCGQGRYANMLDDFGCEALSYGPCGTVEPLVDQGNGYGWLPLAYGQTESPWYDNSADSINAYGFTILEWTGLDYAHTQRAVVQRGGRPGGARFGMSVAKHRVMKVNVLLHGANDRALDFLFNWLADALGSCCSCSEPTMWTRIVNPYLSTVPTSEELERGWVKMRDVVLLEGPTWEAQPTPNSGSVMRAASFTIAAGDPCFYEVVPLGEDSEMSSMATTAHAPSTSTLESACNTFLNSASHASLAVVLPQRAYGTVSPHIFITSPGATRSNGTRKSLPDLRITGYFDPNATYDPASALPDPDRCGLMKIGELILSGNGTSGLDIQIDMAAQEIRYREPGEIGDWHDGSWMIGRPTAGRRRWWGVPRCPGQGLLVVEPAYAGLMNGADYTLYGVSDAITAWTVQFRAFHRYGCC